MTIADLTQIVREIGFPGALLVAIFYAAWKWGWWLLIEVIQPVAKKTIESMEHLSAQCTELVASTKRMCDGLLQVTNKQIEHDKRFDTQDQALSEIQEILKSK
ncbi:MAG: hypothetical protein JWN70_4310 [Planctomycetaceae bacterium]|nr:hypothetical protein [Planctomycetaceae bacterium]